MTTDLAVSIAAKRAIADGVVELTLAPLDGAPLPPWEPGAHVDLILENDLVRQYSLCGDGRLAVLLEEAGRGGSAYVHKRLNAGDVVRIRGPRNNFRLHQAPEYVFLAGGIGITPILPMVHYAANSGAKWHLYYGGRTLAAMAFRDELARYGENVTYLPQDIYGLPDLEAILSPVECGIYCCGPAPMLDAVAEVCGRLGKKDLHVERFTPRAEERTEADRPITVQLDQSGQTIQVPPGTSILQAVRDAGISALSSCGEGTCGTCETAVLKGIPEHRDSVLDEIERETGDCMMICVSRAKTDTLVLDL
ncbi:PDR/VanB family oxidoreductase [Amycolatopsis jejuensis]|uniref:PDR/VanB family oxidoreductase n=1 Tax=Amycolatopsis jejuensis TaxID=330084 RepID=UPI0005254E5E|nr:PDR/VanB family oxidoreductase [Amycolatopsis jejuensis]